MKNLLIRTALLAYMTLTAGRLPAQVPQLISYQGRVGVDGVNFEGSGQFKFAFVNAAGTTTYWSNDGSSTAGSEPGTAIAIPVSKGLYAVLLGDATLDHMSIVPATVFTNGDVHLRVWFSDGVNGFQQLTPDRRIAAVGYAMMADSVSDGAITTAKLADGAVTSEKLAPAIIGTTHLAPDLEFNGITTVVGRLSLLPTAGFTQGVITQDDVRLLHTHGFNNFFAGTGSGNFTMSGDSNTATGAYGLIFNTTGSDNTASGAHALRTNTTGSSNTAIGSSALRLNTTGNDNTALGDIALNANTTGSFNTASGSNALSLNTTGNGNTASGFAALRNNTTGTSNTASGRNALTANTTGLSNMAIGSSALGANTTGGDNTASGTSALSANTTGLNNTATGSGALRLNTTGSSNIALGYRAGQNLTTGSGNITIGHDGVAGESGIIRIGTAQTDTYLTGTIHGDGSGLTGLTVPAANVTGTLGAAQIATGAVGSSQLASDLTLGGTTTGTFSGNLTGNVSGSAASFTGSLAGDVTGTQGATVVSTVGTSSAANVHAAELAANAATSANTPSTIMKRDANGDFSAGTITGSLLGNATTSSGLKTSGADVMVISASTPTAGQMLTATSATTAIWQAAPSPKCDRQVVTVASASTTSGTYVDIPGAVITTHNLGTTGTYVINFCANTYGKANEFVLNINGVDISSSTSKTSVTVSDFYSSTSITFVATNVSSGSIVKARFRTVYAGSTLECQSIQLVIDGVPDSNVQ